MTLAQIFKAVTNQRPEPWKEREATNALIEQLSDRVRELMEQNEALRNALELAHGHLDMPALAISHYNDTVLIIRALKPWEAK